MVSRPPILLLLGACAYALAQEVYITVADTPTTCSTFSPVNRTETPPYHHAQFSYTNIQTVRFATAAPFISQTKYGLPMASLTHLLTNASTTSWSNWRPNATVTANDTSNPYGMAAWSAMWHNHNPPNFTRGAYSTTVAPTPVLSAELVLPPPLYFQPTNCYTFPQGFMLGMAGAAAQIEGAIADEGRGVASPDLELVVAQASAFYASLLGVIKIDADYVANENYYLYKQDIERLAAMGLKYCSVSIPWTHILLFTFPGTPRYDDLINFALSRGIQPIVTLLHNDIPAVFYGNDTASYLEAYSGQRAYYSYTNGGYQYPTFEDAFVNYGKIVMTHFAGRVPVWFTINEPGSGTANGAAIDHVIKSHARLWHFYHEELQGSGQVTMKMSGIPGIPQDPQNVTHIAAVQHYNDLVMGPFLNPLALGIDYPDAYKVTIQDYVPLSAADLEYLNGTMDIVSGDIYGASIVCPIDTDLSTCAANSATNDAAYPSCVGTTDVTTYGWNAGFHPDYFSYSTPTFLQTQLKYSWNTYKRPVMITEFGLSINSMSFPSSTSSLPDVQFDTLRSEYYLSYLNEVLKAIWEDGVQVQGALMWSFADNWGWATFTHEFGIQFINRTTQARSYKRSFFDVVDFVESGRQDVS